MIFTVGDSPTGNRIAAGKVGVAVTEHGFISVEKQMRTNVPHIFVVGDIIGQLPLAHQAVQEAHVATEATHGDKAFFATIRGTARVACTGPGIAWVGLVKEQCNAQCIDFGKTVFPMTTSGRAIADCRSEGSSKPIFDVPTHRVIGSGIAGAHACGFISEPFLAVEIVCDATDIGTTIPPHPASRASPGTAAVANLSANPSETHHG